MSLVKSGFSRIAVETISQSILAQGIERGDEIELVIVCEPPFNVREFVSYLRMTDRIYGRLLDWDLYRYSHLPATQLNITEVRFGSFEIVTAQEITSYLTPLAILWLILKYFPDALKTTSEAYKNWKDARYRIPAETEKLYKEAIKFDEETKAVIVNRKKLEIELRNEERLQNVEEKYLKQIPQMMKEILSKETQDISKARNFSIKNVKDVKIQKRRK